MISIINASLKYGDKIIFSNLDLTLIKKHWTALIGPSGIGKTSLLRYIAGLIPGSSQVLNPKDITYLSQGDTLLPWLTVLQNVCLLYQLKNYSDQQKKYFLQLAHQYLDQVGLSQAKDLYPHQLSGGMKKRVSLVRILLENKPLILMDEPFASLDAITRYQLHELMADLFKEKTVLFITHDPKEALRLSHYIYIMQGNPVKLALVATLPVKIPRPANHPDLVELEEQLFQRLLA